MVKRIDCKVGAIAACVVLAIVWPCVSFAQTATESRRAVVAHAATEIPQFTIQVDAFKTLTEAVEFGYELPFDENTLGLAKFRQGTAVRYILALGTFYTYGEAEGVLRDMCPPASLKNCRVRYLGDLESIDADNNIVPQAPVADAEKNMPALVIEDDVSAPVFDTELVSVPEADYFEQILDEEDKLLQEPSVAEVESVQVQRVQLEQYDAAASVYDGELVYTVQVAVMYQKSDAENVVNRIPVSMGRAEILPLIGGRGNLVHSVTVGRFAYKDSAQVFAEDVCDALGLSGCWVKPLAMIERELELVSHAAVPPAYEAELPQVALPEVELDEPLVPDSLPVEPELGFDNSKAGDSLVYTVQVAAMYDESDAQSVATRIPVRHGATEVVPIRSVNGDVVYSVTVGRFAYKDQGQLVADDICNGLNLSGCWVKPFELIEQARVEEW